MPFSVYAALHAPELLKLMLVSKDGLVFVGKLVGQCESVQRPLCDLETEYCYIRLEQFRNAVTDDEIGEAIAKAESTAEEVMLGLRSLRRSEAVLAALDESGFMRDSFRGVHATVRRAASELSARFAPQAFLHDDYEIPAEHEEKEKTVLTEFRRFRWCLQLVGLSFANANEAPSKLRKLALKVAFLLARWRPALEQFSHVALVSQVQYGGAHTGNPLSDPITSILQRIERSEYEGRAMSSEHADHLEFEAITRLYNTTQDCKFSLTEGVQILEVNRAVLGTVDQELVDPMPAAHASLEPLEEPVFHLRRTHFDGDGSKELIGTQPFRVGVVGEWPLPPGRSGDPENTDGVREGFFSWLEPLPAIISVRAATPEEAVKMLARASGLLGHVTAGNVARVASPMADRALSQLAVRGEAQITQSCTDAAGSSAQAENIVCLPEQCVHHAEAAASISQVEASEIVAEQYASWVSYNAASVETHTASGSAVRCLDFEPIVLLTYSRSPNDLDAVLSRGDELETVRAALEAEGHNWRLPSGAKMFVYPEQFAAAWETVRTRELRPCHVVVAEAFESLVQEAVRRLPARRDVRLRAIEPLGYLGEEDEVVLAQRTFLDVPRPSRSADSVIQSTARVHGVRNPRQQIVQ